MREGGQKWAQTGEDGSRMVRSRDDLCSTHDSTASASSNRRAGVKNPLVAEQSSHALARKWQDWRNTGRTGASAATAVGPFPSG